MASVMSPAQESRVAVSATKLLINNRWVPSESGKTFHRLLFFAQKIENGRPISFHSSDATKKFSSEREPS